MAEIHHSMGHYSNDCRPGEKPFYALAAVLLTIDDHVDIRADLHRIVGGNWWQTVDVACCGDLGRWTLLK
ncbi:MAG: hypothetical protein U1C73_05685 [Dietzia sp.]|nr:hypothetical protein [Dietzia sp.]